jgi:hypothetical protein
MALIGTISGSVGASGVLTTLTAVSGTLVIADTTSANFPVLASDVKFFVSGVQGAIVASLPGVAVFGGDLRVSGSSYFTDIDVTGHGAVIVQPYGTSAGQTGELRFKELAANGGNYTALKAADSIAANLSITLPNAAGSNGNVLQTNGSGVTSFVDVNGLVTGSLSLVTINASSNITASNILANGDLAVNGGDITTSAGTFNLVNATATTVNLGGGASAVNIGAAGSATTFAGNITGSNIVLTGDLTGSNIRLTGDIAVVGGDLTSTAATFNLATNLATQLNVGGTTPTISIGTSTGTSTVGLATGTNTSSLTTKNVNIGTGTGASATVLVNIGSSGSLGRITLNNDVALTTGNIIGSPGTGANVMTLISSGNIIAKLDTDASADGHKFAIQDWRNIDQFTVFETGNAEISGSLIVSGSSLQTMTTTTYNLLTTALTGTLNVGSLATNILVGGTVTTSSIQGAAQIDGRSTLSSVTEKMVPSAGATGTVSFDLSTTSIFHISNPGGTITANFTNVPTTGNRIITPTVILSQSGTPRTITGVQVNGASGSILWANGVTPTTSANKQEIFGFSLIRSGSIWTVLGQMSTYG